MWKDPEAESIANAAARRALVDYDGRIPMERWIARCVKTKIWSQWRKVRDAHTELKGEVWWEHVYTFQDTETDRPLPVSREDWELLCEKFIERWPYDVIADRRGVTEYRATKMVQEAKIRFLEAVESSRS